MDLLIKNITTNETFATQMGSHDNRSWDCSQIVIVGDQFHLNWKWSNENVEHWHYDVGDDTWTEDEDCGDTTELPVISQGALAYDDNDILY